MQSTLLLEPGHYYHIYNRGNNRENIFIEERNYQHFLRLYVKYLEPVTETFAYCLMPNHFHLLVRVKTERPDLDNPANLTPLTTSDVMQQFANFFNAYAKAINKAYGRTGALFQKKFGRRLVTTDRYFTTLVHYIHQNPQKHGFVAHFREWPHSSYNALLGDQPTRLQRGQVLTWFGGAEALRQMHTALADETAISTLIEEDQ